MATTALTPAATGARSGLYDWLTTTDHKKIGILYLVNSFVMFFIGGILALVVRARAGRSPGLQFVKEDDLQPGVHDPRLADAVPVHHPDPGRLRELRRAAPDRRAGHGLPADQRAVVLDAAAGRDPDPDRLPGGRRGGGRLDELRAAVRGQVLGDRPGPLDRRGHPDRDELDPRRDQLPGHDLQDARARDDDVPAADHGLDDARDEHPRRAGDAGPDERPDHAVHRPQLRRPLLRPGDRRQRDPVAERVLVLLASRRLHHGPAGDGHRQRGPAGVQPQAAVRLQGVRLRHGRDRRPRLQRVGPPHVHDRGGRTCRSSAS